MLRGRNIQPRIPNTSVIMRAFCVLRFTKIIYDGFGIVYIILVIFSLPLHPIWTKSLMKEEGKKSVSYS